MKNFVLCLFLSFFLYIESSSIINSQYSPNHKYCIEKENPSFFDSLNSILDSVGGIIYNTGEALIDFNSKYSSFSEYSKAKRYRENEFRMNFPTSYLKGIALKNNVNCIIYDKRMDMYDDGRIIETPYNFRPLE